MAPELQKYYEDYMDLFVTEGWKAFQEDIKAASDSIDILSLNDAKELHISQGKLDVFLRLLNWEQAIRNSYDELLNSEVEDA